MTSATLSPPDLLDDPLFSRLKAHLIEMTGLSYYATQDLELARHFFQRLVAQALPDCSAYWSFLHDGKPGEEELDLLIASLTIGETFFFRHEEQFNSLRERVLPEVIERNRSQRSLRIWSAGCATGAEPYSLAILLKQGWGDILADWDVSIVGTDINRIYLAQARQGRFGEWALRATPEPLQTACFSKSGNEWLVRPQYRQWVSFQHHNLVRDPFPAPSSDLWNFDVILCRNVMIYFNHEVIRRVVGQFHECLVDNGWLLVGHAESQSEFFPQFKTVDRAEAVLYQKSVNEALPAEHALGSASRIKRFDASNAWQCPPQTECPIDLLAAALPPIAAASNFPRKSTNGHCVRRPDAWEEAVERCQEQLAEEPLNPQFHFSFALLLQERGRHDDAEQALRRTLYLDRDFVLAHFDLGLLLERRAELSGARRCFRNALRLLETIDQRFSFSQASGLDAAALGDAARAHLEVLKNL